MKIYHTETQADYDALMIELEAEGCKWSWSFPRKLTETSNWHIWGHLTCLRVYDLKVNYASLNYYKKDYPNIPITKYKVEADDKMRFTKENVLKLTDKWVENKIVSFQDLQNQIKELDDTPEKVVVPKFVADYLEDCKKRNIKLVSALCPFKMGYGKEIELWFDNEDNNRLFALAWINGYEVEKEPFSWAVKGITDYFKCDGKIIVFKNEEEALEVANLIGINTEVEKMNNIDCQDCISIEELREETK